MAGASPVQTQEDLVPPAPSAIGYRLTGVLLAAPVAVATQVLLAGPFGIDLQVPEGPGSSALRDLDLLSTTVVALVLSLVGLLVVKLLERGLGGERGRRIWVTLAFVVFVVSLAPVAVLDVPISVKWGLFVLHAVVALVLIPTLSNGRAATNPVAGGWVAAHAEAAAAQETLPPTADQASPLAATGHDQADDPVHATGPAAH